MVEVFKTNVHEQDEANMLVAEIHKLFNNYTINFDLEDCDKILRVECSTGFIQSLRLIDLFKKLGFNAEVLPDDEHSAWSQIVSKYYSTKAG
jgi:hypothetical protein